MEKNKEKTNEVKKINFTTIIILLACIALIGVIGTWEFLTQVKRNVPIQPTVTKPLKNETANIVDNTSVNKLKENEIKNVVAVQEENVVKEVKTEIEEDENTESDASKKEENKTETAIAKNDEKKNTDNKNEETKKSNSSTQSEKKKEETKKEELNKTEEVNKPEEPPKPTKTGTDTTEKLTKTETKYGVKTNTYTITTYDVYSDGSKIEKNKKTRTEIDNSEYSATTAELLPEAKQVKSKNSGIIQEVLKYTNQYRKEANKNKENEISDRKDLVLDSNLTLAACVRAIEMGYSENFSHKRPNGSYCFTAMDDLGVRYYEAGENIAWGQSSAKSATTWWKNSSGHYANMINKEFGKIGIGVAKINGRYYWVQLFTN